MIYENLIRQGNIFEPTWTGSELLNGFGIHPDRTGNMTLLVVGSGTGIEQPQ